MDKKNIFLSKIDDFLDKKTLKNKVIVVYWPTACWKTSLWIDIAKYLNTEIISTDSRQIFKYLDIWTGKATLQEMQWIKHHFIDIINPSEEYSVWEFKKEALKIINDLHKNWKIPILVWWTGLYIDSLIYDFDIPSSPSDKNLRFELEQKAKEFWKEYVWNILNEIDPEYAKTVHYNNLNYVIRWIEVKKITWLSKLDFKQEKKLKFETLFLTPYDENREKLYEKINLRVFQMFENGLIEEVKNILKMWYTKNDFWLKTIWYTEVLDYLDEKISLNEAISIVSQHNRNYAKRQLTWFRKYEK